MFSPYPLAGACSDLVMARRIVIHYKVNAGLERLGAALLERYVGNLGFMWGILWNMAQGDCSSRVVLQAEKRLEGGGVR